MCGICGIVNTSNNRKIEKQIIQSMLDKIRHRGPDGSDMYIDDVIGFGFNRLSFLDLSGGMQPLTNEDGICDNGV